MAAGAHDGKYISRHHRPLERLAADHISCLIPIVHMRSGRGGEDYPLRLGELGLTDLHLVPDSNAGVLADEAVNPYIILRPILPVGAPDLGCGKPLPLNLNDVTRTEPQG